MQQKESTQTYFKMYKITSKQNTAISASLDRILDEKKNSECARVQKPHLYYTSH